MRTHPPSHGRYWCALIFSLFSCLAGCKKESAHTPPTPEAGQPTAAPRDFHSSEEPNQEVELAVRSEPGILSRELYRFAGTMDTQNRYASTVMVHLSDPDLEPACSGVLIAPRLVLTAAHCVCPDQACSKKALATIVRYGATLNFNYKEETTEMGLDVHEGVVRPHPEFKLVQDESGNILSEHANLATILLDKPVSGAFPSTTLPDTEAKAGEFLLMAGYASKSKAPVGGVYGVRYFRRNVVSNVKTSASERIIYEQQGPYTYNGFPGGPCFREQGTQRWLVGIAGTESIKDFYFTSTFIFKQWLVGEIHHATRAPLDSGVER